MLPSMTTLVVYENNKVSHIDAPVMREKTISQSVEILRSDFSSYQRDHIHSLHPYL